jgi:hypothetical protein
MRSTTVTGSGEERLRSRKTGAVIAPDGRRHYIPDESREQRPLSQTHGEARESSPASGDDLRNHLAVYVREPIFLLL